MITLARHAGLIGRLASRTLKPNNYVGPQSQYQATDTIKNQAPFRTTTSNGPRELPDEQLKDQSDVDTRPQQTSRLKRKSKQPNRDYWRHIHFQNLKNSEIGTTQRKCKKDTK